VEIKLFINNKGPFNLYIINCRLKLYLLTLILSATPALVILNNFSIVKLPLPINIIALLINVTAPPINITALSINIIALPINIIRVL
jgi:hypothetical protein